MYDDAVRSRVGWSTLCRDSFEHWRERMETCAPVAVRDVMCEMCSRIFRRQSDTARHKCMEERRKPIREQQGSIQCSTCFK